MSWIRLHKPPKKCRKICKTINDLGGIKDDAKSKYLYEASRKRFLNDPQRASGYKILGKSLRSGMMGSINSFRFYID